MNLSPLSAKQRTAVNHAKSDKFSYLAVGAIRSGKTFACCLGFILYTQETQPRQSHLISGSNKNTIDREIIPTFYGIADMLNAPISYNASTGTLRFGATEYYVAAGVNEASLVRIRGLTIGSALIDEVVLTPESFFKETLGRLSFAESKVWMTTNPGRQRHWLKEKWIDTGKIDTVEKLLMDDNPTLHDTVKERNTELFSGVFYTRMIGGEWGDAEGLIYRDYQVADREIPDHLIRRRYIGIDYGTSSATAFVSGLELKDGTTYIDRVYKWDAGKQGRMKSDEEYVNDLIQFAGHKRITCKIDPSAASFITALRQTKKQHKMVFHLAKNDVLQGIRRTMNELANGGVTIAETDTRPLLDEMQEYEWDQTKSEDKPVKENDHAADALRYLVYSTRLTRGGLVHLEGGL